MSNLFETEANAKPATTTFDKRNGKPKIRVEFEILDGPHAGKRVPWDGKLDDRNVKYTKRDLVSLGWQGKTSATIVDDITKAAKTVRIKTRIARYNRDDGTVSEWTSVDRIFTGEAKPGEAVTKDDIENVDRWFAEADGASGSDASDDDRIPF